MSTQRQMVMGWLPAYEALRAFSAQAAATGEAVLIQLA